MILYSKNVLFFQRLIIKLVNEYSNLYSIPWCIFYKYITNIYKLYIINIIYILKISNNILLTPSIISPATAYTLSVCSPVYKVISSIPKISSEIK